MGSERKKADVRQRQSSAGSVSTPKNSRDSPKEASTKPKATTPLASVQPPQSYPNSTSSRRLEFGIPTPIVRKHGQRHQPSSTAPQHGQSKMETNTNPRIASIQKNFDPDPQLSENDESDLWGDLEDCCESEEQYVPQSANSKGALYPICIGDIIHYPDGRYEIVHRLGKGAYSVVWLARDLKRNICVALKVMVAGSIGEKEFLNQHMLKKALHLDTSRLNLYKDTFLLPSPYNATGKPPTMFHRVLVLPLEGPSLSEGLVQFDRSLRSRMAAAKSLLETLRDLHQAGFVHSGKLWDSNIKIAIRYCFRKRIMET
ncbi:hypothetical protein N8I77_010841 [Diaporthe amygdali]|uniref:Protein kinase domain-containing protein n=1 Tax=Phomopsis amygdali TaxID=1214568 RepID=A0AAD9S977_PHOAM|nr:hypothetical protein N8I77_010841 [Diaporthe amygdali]